MTQLQDDMLIPYEEMLKAGMHFGRRKAVFNPGMGKYVVTVRDGISIIDLLKTQEALKDTVEFMKGILQKNGLILFVAATKQSQEATVALARSLNMPYAGERWIGGTLTNYKNINGRVKKLEEMEKEIASGTLDRYTKKERLLFERTTKTMQRSFDGLKRLKEGQMAVREARKMGVPIVSIANTDANPAGIMHVIPANDRSKRSADLILDALKHSLALHHDGTGLAGAVSQPAQAAS